MDIFVILISALFASVKSDVGLGYQYRAPATSYDVPFRSVGNLHSDRKYYHVENQNYRLGGVVPTIPTLLSSTVSAHSGFGGNVYHEDNLSPTISSLVSTPIHEQNVHNIDNNLLHLVKTPIHGQNFIERKNVEISNLLPTTPASVLQTPMHDYTYFTNPGSTQKKTSFVHKPVPESQLIDVRSHNPSENLVNVGPHSQNVEVQKHLYFYTAPEEPEEIRPRVIAPAATAKKNVKILFIKAPTFKFAPVHIPSQVQNEDKTLVYVLVKKPDEPEHIIVPTPESTKPTKPEVFFIKYKTQSEADDAISNIQNQRSEIGGGHHSLSSIEESALLDPRYRAQNVVKSDINQNNNLASRILPIPSGVLPSDGDFSHLNVNSEHVYNGLRKGNAEISPTLAPDTHSEQFSTITNLVNEKVNEFGIGSTTVTPINLPTSTSSISDRIGIHEVYGPPQKR